MQSTYWHQHSVENEALRQLKSNIDVDVVVIGAGYTGLSCAQRCASAGLNTVVLEQGGLGEGASGHNTGQWLPGWAGKSPDQISNALGERNASVMNDFMVQAIRNFEALVLPESDRLQLKRSGILQLAMNKKDYFQLKAKADQLDSLGLEVDVVSEAGVKDHLDTDCYLGGMYYKQAGTIDPLKFLHLLAEKARRSGASIFTSSPAYKVENDGHGWCVETPLAKVYAKKLVMATNAYQLPISHGNANRSIIRMPISVLLSEQLGAAECSSLIKTPFMEVTKAGLFGGYVTADNRWLCSTLPPVSNKKNLDETGRWSAKRFKKIFPDAAPLNWSQTWQRGIAITRDAMPVATRLSKNAYAVYGFSGAGLVMAPALGREIANVIVEDDDAASRYPLTEPQHIPMCDTLPWLMRRLAFPVMRRVDMAGFSFRHVLKK